MCAEIFREFNLMRRILNKACMCKLRCGRNEFVMTLAGKVMKSYWRKEGLKLYRRNEVSKLG